MRQGQTGDLKQQLERDKRKTSAFDPEKSKPQVEKRYLGHPTRDSFC
jgi:hypothetical protein